MINETAKSLLLEKQTDCFSCKYGTSDLGCIHEDNDMDLLRVCELWEYCGDEDMNRPFDSLKRNEVIVYTASGPVNRNEMIWREDG